MIVAGARGAKKTSSPGSMRERERRGKKSLCEQYVNRSYVREAGASESSTIGSLVYGE